ncbi:MAG: ATP-binding protein [Chloroflexota bacterium]|nr:ATP-binding protein [Chloroflexota bacterium]
MYGYEAGEMIGQEKIYRLFPAKERALKRLLEVNALTIQNGMWEGLLKQQRKNGQVFTAYVTITARRNSKEKAVGLLMLAKDLSQELILEDLQFEEFKIAQLYTRSLIEANVDILIVTDTKGIITDINHQMCQVTGQYREEILGSLFKTYFTDPQRAQEEICTVLALNKMTNYDLTMRLQQGKLIDFSCNATTFHNARGQAIAVLITARDVTDRKTEERRLALLFEREQAARTAQENVNEQLQHLNQLQNDFIAVMSHEFRTTLTGIQGFSELLRDQEWSIEEVKEYADDINTDAKRLTRMLTDSLDLGQMQSGKMVLHLEQVDLNALIAGAVERVRSMTLDHTFFLNLDASLPFVEADRDKLTQVMTNMLSNAIKYSPQGGSILVTQEREGHDVHIRVQDQGVGIPEDALEQIFTPYNRIASEKTRYIQGTGLGLAIVREIILLHKGKVWAESAAGEGSCFHITLPLVE